MWREVAGERPWSREIRRHASLARSATMEAPKVTDGPRSSRAWLLLAAAAVLAVVGVGRLVLDVSATALGTSVSCGNALSWMGGADKTARSTLLAVCGAPLHNASIEGAAAVVAAVILALGWLVAVRARWPLASLAALVAFIVGTIVASPVVGLVAAVALLVVFSVWRGVARHRRTA